MTTADYERAAGLREKYEAVALNVPGPATWVEKTHRFWYRRSVKGGNEFVLVDADTGQKRPAFDHERLAATLAKRPAGSSLRSTLPFNTFTFTDNERAIEARFDGRAGPARSPTTRAEGAGGRRVRAAPPPPACTPPGPDASRACRPTASGKPSSRNYNVAVRGRARDDRTILSTDGSEGNCYDCDSIAWSPDSKKLAAYRVQAGLSAPGPLRRVVADDQLQPKHSTRVYAKPGDVLDFEQPVLFDVDDAARRS